MLSQLTGWVGDEGAVLLASFAVSVAMGVLLLVTRKWHEGVTADGTAGIQKLHLTPTPRIGGVPIFVGMLAVYGLLSDQGAELLGPLLVAGLPAFGFGLAEDLTKRVGVMERLLATMASGLLACFITGYSLTRVDVVGLDTVLAWWPLSLAFTAFAVGGVANAINIIDGLNGLASSMVMWALLGFAGVAYQYNDVALVHLCLWLVAATLGFWVLNFPWGKLFLGDGGSYFLGFALAWIAVMLMERHPEVSAFSALMLCIHPVTEVLFSVYRRRVRKEHPGMPDRLHFHSLVKRRLIKRLFPTMPSTLRNSLAGVLVGSLTVVPALWVQWVHASLPLSVVSVVFFVLVYLALYARIVRFHWCSPMTFLMSKPVVVKRA